MCTSQLLIDEGTDLGDTAQLAIFVRGVDNDFVITEEMAALFPMKGTTKGIDILNALIATLQRFDLKVKILAGLYSFNFREINRF